MRPRQPRRKRRRRPATTETDGAANDPEPDVSDDDEAEVLDLRTRQYAFREIIKGSLYAGIEYDDGFARRWYPEPRSRAVTSVSFWRFSSCARRSCLLARVRLRSTSPAALALTLIALRRCDSSEEDI